MNNWQKVKLSEVCDILSGYAWKAPKFKENGSIPIIRIQNLTSDNLLEDFVWWDESYDEKFVVRAGDLLVSLSGSIKVFEWNQANALLNQRIIKVSVNNKANKRWFYWKLNSILHDIVNLGKHSIINNISLNDLKEIEILLPPIEEQKRIADILDKADALRQKDVKLIKKYDELAQSIFIDMFGDPVANNKDIVKKKIRLLANTDDKYAIKAGPFGSSLKKDCYVNSGYKVYGQEQVIADNLNIGDYYIGEAKFRELESCRINTGDVLISLVGTYGKISVVPQYFEDGIINPRLMKITLDNTVMNPYFFKFLMQFDSQRKYISTFSRGGTMDIINVGIISEIDVIVPPLDKQNKFIEILNKIKNSVLHVQTKKDSEQLFQSLLQLSFNGKLIHHGDTAKL